MSLADMRANYDIFIQPLRFTAVDKFIVQTLYINENFYRYSYSIFTLMKVIKGVDTA